MGSRTAADDKVEGCGSVWMRTLNDVDSRERRFLRRRIQVAGNKVLKRRKNGEKKRKRESENA